MTTNPDSPTFTYLDKACEVITKFEGFRSYPYESAAGVWCIGYGTTVYPDGKIVSPRDHIITKDRATEFLVQRVQKEIVFNLARTIPHWKEMASGQKAALISFAYNVGAYFYGSPNFHTLTIALKSKDTWSRVPDALRLYVNPGSAFEAGLKARRKAEAELWISP